MTDDQQAAREAAYKVWDDGFPALTTYDDPDVFAAGWDAGVVWERGRGVPDEDKPAPGFWPGDVDGGIPGVTDRKETGPIGAGTPHARMRWFWDRMEKHGKLIEELTGWNPISSTYRFEAAVADAFEVLAGRGVRDEPNDPDLAEQLSGQRATDAGGGDERAPVAQSPDADPSGRGGEDHVKGAPVFQAGGHGAGSQPAGKPSGALSSSLPAVAGRGVPDEASDVGALQAVIGPLIAGYYWPGHDLDDPEDEAVSQAWELAEEIARKIVAGRGVPDDAGLREALEWIANRSESPPYSQMALDMWLKARAALAAATPDERKDRR